MDLILNNFNQETLWFLVVIYDLSLAIFLYRLFGKYGLYCAVVLGIVLGNLQGGKISELEIFGMQFNVSTRYWNNGGVNWINKSYVRHLST